MGTALIQLEISVTWIDARLVYKNLEKEEDHVVSDDQKTLIWMPKIILNNAKPKKVITFKEKTSTGMVTIDDKSIRMKSPIDELQNFLEYNGKDG